MNKPFLKPSLKALAAAFGADKAPALRAAMDKSATAGEALEHCDTILQGHGVEFIPAGHNSKSPSIKYVNMGDTYSTTIMRVRGNLRIGCWGDIVERGNYD